MATSQPTPVPDDPKVVSLRPRARGRGGGERERLTSTEKRVDLLSLTTPPHPLDNTARVLARRALLASERLLARWLRARLHTAGSEAMVRKYGARVVLDALYDGVVCEEPVYRPAADGRQVVEVGRRLVVSPLLRNPGGYLRWVLEGER